MSLKKTFSLFDFWKNLSISKKLYFVVGAMAILILIELITLRFAMGNVSALRAFVGGEASWSKAQKNAVYHFQRYAMTKNEADYIAFHEFLKVPDGDRKARLELLKKNPDMQVARSGFLEGHIHPDDIDPMMNLLKRFYKVSYIQEAIKAWSEGDALLVELRSVAVDYHNMVINNEKDQIKMVAALDRVIKINDSLSSVEENFSRVLGEGSRWLESIVFMILFILVITVESIGLTLTFFTNRAITRGLSGLNKITEEFAHGNFQRRLEVVSGDEIGQLTNSINEMGDILQKSYNDLETSYKDLEKKVELRTAELAEVANQNNELYKEAKSAVRMRDDFLSIASHELRTPLTALNLQLYLLEKSSGPEGKNLDIDQINKITKRSSLLIKKLATLQEALMDLAQLRLGALEIKRAPCDISAIILDCVAQANSLSARSGVEIILNSSQKLLGLVDATRVGQVVTNLISNAVKYGEGRPVEVNVSAKDNFLQIKVIDQGLGIPKNKQDQIFDRFERVNEDPAVSGLGLGLYISKQITEAHGGTITVQSSPSGSVFTATFSLI